MPKTLVRSARSPVNMKLDKSTSFCTSRAMLSTVPGLESPRAALRSEKDPYASLIAAASELSVMNESADEKSAILSGCEEGVEVEEEETVKDRGAQKRADREGRELNRSEQLMAPQTYHR